MRVVELRENSAKALPEVQESPLVRFEAELASLAADVARLKTEAPAARAEQFARLSEQVAIGHMMLDDCALRSKRSALSRAQLGNLEKWIAGIRRAIEARRYAQTESPPRKFYVVRRR